MRKLCFVLFALGLFPHATLAHTPRRPLEDQSVALVRSFYRPNFKPESIPLSGRLHRLLAAAEAHSRKTGGPVSGLDFDWTMNAQDGAPGWQKSAHFSLADHRRKGTVRVTFRNFKQDNDLRYDLVVEHGQWKVDDIRSLRGEIWVLSKMLERGAKE